MRLVALFFEIVFALATFKAPGSKRYRVSDKRYFHR